jgi:hypothetical protein
MSVHTHLSTSVSNFLVTGLAPGGGLSRSGARSPTLNSLSLPLTKIMKNLVYEGELGTHHSVDAATHNNHQPTLRHVTRFAVNRAGIHIEAEEGFLNICFSCERPGYLNRCKTIKCNLLSE